MRRATGPNSGPSFSTQPGSSYLIVGELKVLCTCLADLNLFDDTMLFSRTVVVFRMTCVAVHTDGHLAVRIARIRQSRCSMSDCPAQWLFPPATKMAGWCGETCRNPDTLSLNRRPPTQRSFWIQSVAAARFDRIFGKRIALVPDVGGVGSPLREGRHDRPRIVVSRDAAGFRNRSKNSQRLYSRFPQEMETGIT